MCDGHGIVLISEESFWELLVGLQGERSRELKVQMSQLDARSTKAMGSLGGHFSLLSTEVL